MNQLAGILVGLFGGGVVGTLGSGVIAAVAERRSHWRDDRRQAYGEFVAAITAACDAVNYVVSAQRSLRREAGRDADDDTLAGLQAQLEAYVEASAAASAQAGSAYRLARLLMSPATDRALMTLVLAFNDLLWAAQAEVPAFRAAGFEARPESASEPFDVQMHAVFDKIRLFIDGAQDDMNLRAWWRRSR